MKHKHRKKIRPIRLISMKLKDLEKHYYPCQRCGRIFISLGFLEMSQRFCLTCRFKYWQEYSSKKNIVVEKRELRGNLRGWD